MSARAHAFTQRDEVVGREREHSKRVLSLIRDILGVDDAMDVPRVSFLFTRNDVFVHQARTNLPRSPDCTHTHVYARIIYMCVNLHLSRSLSFALRVWSEVPSPSPKCLLSLVGRTVVRFVGPVSRAREETPYRA